MPVLKGVVDPRDIWTLLWNKKWFVILGCVACAAALIGVSLLLPKKYEATVVMSPVSMNTQGAGGGLGSLMSQFGGIASLAGLSVGGTDAVRNESLGFLRSKQLVSDYIVEHDLQKILFSGKHNAQPPQTLWKAVEFFSRKVRTVTVENNTGMVLLRVVWEDPRVAATWANDLVATANARLRGRAIAESERNIAYLNEQAGKTDVVGMKQGIYSLLQTEINKVMIARGAEQFAFKVIDPAVAPEKPSSPGLLVWAGFGVLLALLAAVSVAFLYSVFRAAP